MGNLNGKCLLIQCLKRSTLRPTAFTSFPIRPHIIHISHQFAYIIYSFGISKCYLNHYNFFLHRMLVWWFGLCCLTALSTLFQLYRGGQFYWWRKYSTSHSQYSTSHSQYSTSYSQYSTSHSQYSISHSQYSTSHSPFTHPYSLHYARWHYSHYTVAQFTIKPYILIW